MWTVTLTWVSRLRDPVSTGDLSVFGALRRRQRLLWVLAVALYGVGDTATTIAGLGAATVVEAGPIAGPFIERAGVGGLLLLKAGFLAVCALVWSVVRTPGRVGIPAALAVVGLVVTSWNLAMLGVF